MQSIAKNFSGNVRRGEKTRIWRAWRLKAYPDTNRGSFRNLFIPGYESFEIELSMVC